MSDETSGGGKLLAAAGATMSPQQGSMLTSPVSSQLNSGCGCEITYIAELLTLRLLALLALWRTSVATNAGVSETSETFLEVFFTDEANVLKACKSNFAGDFRHL